MNVEDTWDEMSIYFGHDEKKNIVISERTLAMVIIYGSIECENDYFEGQIMKT